MIPKQFDGIVAEDVEALVTNGVKEARDLEYKETLPGGSEGDKKEFLYDVSALANASGGDLIFGVSEQRDANGQPTGLPDRIVGLRGANLGQEQLRLEQLVQTGVDPRVPGLRMKPVTTSAGDVLLIRVLKSWVAPHMVTLGGVIRFYSRNSAGKYQLDVREIRAAFLATNARGKEVREFRAERIARIAIDEASVVLSSPHRILVHVVPFVSLEPGFAVDVERASHHVDLLWPMYTDATSRRFNFDGFLCHDGTSSYLQLFRSAALESVEAKLLDYEIADEVSGEPKMVIASRLYEEEIIVCVERALALQRRMLVPPPFFVMVALLGVKGYEMALGKNKRERHYLQRPTIDRDHLIGDAIVIEEDSDNVAARLRPVFDTFWQAAGLARSLNYDVNGIWLPR